MLLAVYLRKRVLLLVIGVLLFRRYVLFNCAAIEQIQPVAVYDSLFCVVRDIASSLSESLRYCWPNDICGSTAVVFL